MLRVDRGSGGPDRFLSLKLALFFLGAGFLVGGMTTGRDWAVAVAFVVLLAGMVVRFLGRRSDAAREELPPDDPDGPA